MKRKLPLLLLVTSVMVLTGCGKKSKTSGTSSVSSSGVDETSLNSSEDNNSLNSSEVNSGTASSSEKDPDALYGTPDKVILHYSTLDGNYTNYSFWFWSSQYKPLIETKKDGLDDFGMYVEIDTADYIKNGETSLWFLVKSTGSWSYQTADIEIVYDNYKYEMVDGEKVMNIYASGLSKNNIELADYVDTNKGAIISASFDSKNKVTFKTTHEMSGYKIYACDREYQINGYTNVEMAKVVAQGNVSGTEATITLDDFDFQYDIVYKIYVIYANDVKSGREIAISCNKLYKSDDFLSIKYDGDDLGLTWDEDGKPVFKVFAPTSPVVKLNIYTKGYSANLEKDVELTSSQIAQYNNPAYTFVMAKGENGIHTSEGIEGSTWDLVRTIMRNEKYYYTYEVDNINGLHEVVDPYAYATSLNSQRGAIIKLDNEKAIPEGWENVPEKWDGTDDYDIDNPTELVVSENHIRDLTMNETWTDDEEKKAYAGTYKGFSMSGTTYTKDGVTVKTGFDHLEEYGVNAVQLLPIFDSDNDDLNKKYNWGYDPLNYNIPEGNYATDAKDPFVRIKELRGLVEAYANNANHTRIIMDVVYNHVSNATSSNFEYLVPGYYFRTDEDGSFLDGSGCGNEFNSNNPMAKKFIVDSVVHWAKDYKIKGFRFDLMGLISTDTMKAVKEALYEVDPDIVVYGEGWDATGAYYGNSNYANTDSVFQQLYSSSSSKGQVGAFNDAGRNAIRGENNGGNHYPGYGIIAQGEADINRENMAKVSNMIKGIHDGKGANPLQVVNYASCHDNYTLFDQLNYTLSKDGGKTEPNMEDVCRASVCVNGTVILSNGMSFINGGEELFRSKVEYDENAKDYVTMYGKMISYNSYKSGDATNSYNYANKVDYLSYFNMYRELIQIKKDLKYIPYDKNCNDTSLINTWDYDSSAGGTKIATYRQGKGDYNYFFFLNGRSDSASFGYGSGGEEIFNTGVATTYNKTAYTVNSTQKYSLSVYKASK